MIVFSTVIFLLALLGIVLLFSLRAWEISRGARIFPGLRAAADREALELKELLEAGRKDLEHVGPLLLHALQRIVHGIATDMTFIALWFAKKSHNLADSVSHKRNFERRETSSEFLKKVSKRKESKEEDGEGDQPVV